MIPSRNCLICSTSFVPAKGNHRACSLECRKVHRKKYLAGFHARTKSFISKEICCSVCATSFFTKHSKELFCSAICREKNRREKFKVAQKSGRYRVRQKSYYQENKREIHRKIIERRRRDPILRLKMVLRTRLGHAIKGRSKSGPTLGYIGCTVEHLRTHIESLWLPGMSWENYGLKGWHIDHRQPLAAFNLFDQFGNENTAQICAAMHFTNLQPLWAADNIRKGASLVAL